MVKITAEYLGDLHCELTHGPSGKKLQTDAPKDNMGRGGSFSPTDLCASSLLTCMLTSMAIYGKRHEKELSRMEGEVLKEMSSDTPRRIVKLTVTIQMPKGLTAEERPVYERVAENCPVFKSLSPDTQIITHFKYSA